VSTLALYRFYAADDQLLYVGLTINPGKRMERHRGEKPWWNDIARVTLEHHESIEALRSWWDGEAHGGAFLVPRDQVAHWTFYRDHEYMQAGLGCREDFGPRRPGTGWPEGVCGRDVNYIIRDSPLGPILRCGRCIEFYSGKVEPWPG
jgi:hypothetical protein